MTAAERARALAAKAKLEPVDQAHSGRSTVFADLDWAWDPEWLVALAEKPGAVLTKGRPPGAGACPRRWRFGGGAVRNARR
jgi:hypothetical protein